MSTGVTPRDGADEPAGPTPDDLARGARHLRVVAAILLVEALALVVFAGYLLVNLVAGTKQTTATTNTVIETVAFALVAVALAKVGVDAAAHRRWTRAPILVTQIITLLGPGINIVRGDLWYRFVLGVPLTLASVVAIYLILTPSVTASMEAAENSDD